MAPPPPPTHTVALQVANTKTHRSAWARVPGPELCVCGGGGCQGCIRTAVHRRRRGGTPPPSPTSALLPMFEADSQSFASATSVPRRLKLQKV